MSFSPTIYGSVSAEYQTFYLQYSFYRPFHSVGAATPVTAPHSPPAR